MADYQAMETFVAVVRSGSFRGASEALHVPRSTVSQRVSRLEAQLGARLLDRTTRSVRVTEVGSSYYERCARIVAEVEDANLAVSDVNASPRGVLRVGCPLLFGHAFVAGVATSFIQKYPDVSIEVVATDRRLSLIEEGFDVAVGLFTGEETSNVVTRKLTRAELRWYASPAYLAKRGAPRAPEELREHACVVFGDTRDATWHFERGLEQRTVRVTGRLSMNSLMMARDAARCGAGIVPLPFFLVAEDLREGRLAPVLEGWASSHADLRVAYASTRHLSPRIRLFVDALVDGYRQVAVPIPPAAAGPASGVRRVRRARAASA
ncbi:MAG: LysR family transcriptional regulator [Polyangiaceae bacterium]|jgi:DNA-binding transcriptional LysR family regulator